MSEVYWKNNKRSVLSVIWKYTLLIIFFFITIYSFVKLYFFSNNYICIDPNNNRLTSKHLLERYTENIIIYKGK